MAICTKLHATPPPWSLSFIIHKIGRCNFKWRVTAKSILRSLTAPGPEPASIGCLMDNCGADFNPHQSTIRGFRTAAVMMSHLKVLCHRNMTPLFGELGYAVNGQKARADYRANA